MVQHDIKKKTGMYAFVAVLSAVLLVTMVYSLGSPSIIYPPSQTPQVVGMKHFDSLDDLKNFVNANSNNGWYRGGPLDSKFFSTGMKSVMPTSVPSALTGANSFSSEGAPAPTYSTTNIQVAGIDEADTVKTDGRYIYVASSIDSGGSSYGYDYYRQPQRQNAVYILNADPQNVQVVSKIPLDNNTEPAGLFLSADSSRLVVIASKYQMYAPSYSTSSTRGMLKSYSSDVNTYLNVYDVSNKAEPVLARNLTVTGSYFNSRMIGNYVYTVISQPANVYNDNIILPAAYDGCQTLDASPQSIYYADMNDSSNYCSFTSFYGLDIADDAVAPSNLTVVMGGASSMYVSPSNIYVAYPTWTDGGQFTSIYRVSINGLQLNFEAQGNVPGNTLNQYSMDEYNGNFRIATNWQQYDSKSNNLYILNSSLSTIGKIEGLAANENLHSVRFMGDKCYLVTFQKTDPLFVIDVSQPTNPQVLGELKIPGYSDYLHPYDETHLIGLGKEAIAAEEGDFAWYQGLQLSLFDVSNVNSPVQLSKYAIGDRGTDSAALSEPKAFLFDKQKGLLVIPVNLSVIDNKSQASSWSYGTMVWQGAYVFSLSLDGGFVLRGNITHIDYQAHAQNSYSEDLNYYNNPTENAVYSQPNNWITRSLYIDNTLYTISNSQIRLNNLSDLTQTAQINLQ